MNNIFVISENINDVNLSSVNSNVPKQIFVPKLYKRRYLMLFLYSLFSFANTAQWGQYVIVSNIMSRYYNVSLEIIECTAIIFSIVALTSFFIMGYIRRKLGFKITICTSTIGTAIGTWLKLLAVDRDRIFLVFISQGLIAHFQIIVTSSIPQIAAIWFDTSAVSLASSIAYFGCLCGFTVMLLMMPVFVENGKYIEDIQNQYYNFQLGNGIINTVIAVVICIYFEDQPPIPPSEARAIQMQVINPKKDSFKNSLSIVFHNVNFILLWISNGLSVAVLASFTNLLTPYMLEHFKDSNKDAGLIGSLMYFFGSVLSVICCRILDKTKAYKKMAATLKGLSVISYILVILSLYFEQLWAMYISGILVGIFLTANLLSDFEFSSEIVFPELETATTVLFASAQICTLILQFSCEALLEDNKEFWAHALTLLFIFIGFILIYCIKSVYRRQNPSENISEYKQNN